MKYITKFETTTQYNAAKDGLILPNVSLITETNDVAYNPTVAVTGVSLNKSTLELAKGATETLVATVLPNDASNKAVTWSSSDESVATVDNNGVVTAVGNGGNAAIKVTTADGGFTAQCILTVTEMIDGHEYVEIGGLKWATMNVGATDVTDSGLYFQWGDTQGYTADQVGEGEGKKSFNWKTYKYGNGKSSQYSYDMTKYNSKDGKTVLEPSDDAVTAAWGSNWRMPSKQELYNLYYASSSYFSTNYKNTGAKGLVLVSKTDSKKELFLPAAGNAQYTSMSSDYGRYGYYWTNEVSGSGSQEYAFHLEFNSSEFVANRGLSRNLGLCIRGVVNE